MTTEELAAQPRQNTAKAAFIAREALLWSAWRNKRCAATRHALVDHYAGWTRVVARDVFVRVRVQGAEWTDYVHYATIGLLECLDRFDPDKGVHFQTYARHRLRGAILNNIGRFAERSSHGNGGRYAERTESLDAGGSESGDTLRDLIDVSVGLAIGYLLELGTVPSSSQPENDAYRQLESEHLEANLAMLVDKLPDKERAVVTGHYYQQMSFVEVAAMLELTKGRISQLHRQAMNRIRLWLEEQDSFGRSL